ncbi:MAG: GAF domain-containing protein [Actinomycetota bacterium]|nr:GAF domain-containing protein [Actinomycetota bacterium]
MVSESFCATCLRTVYAGGNESCPVCASPLLKTGVAVAENADPVTVSTSIDPSLIPDNESLRLEAVKRYEILDTPRDGAFDRITFLASKIFNVPISTVTIVDSDRIWFKSAQGLEAEQIDRDPGLCASAILVDEPWVVEDAKRDPRTLENPLVLGDLGLRFYAGVPLVTGDGYKLGMLNIIDRQPRELSEDELSILQELSKIVVDELELRLAARRMHKELSAH